MRRVFLLALFLFGWHQAAGPAPGETPLAEKYLTEGQLADGVKALLAHLHDSPRDDETRFGLGVSQFVRSLERLSQDLHWYGLRDSSRTGPTMEGDYRRAVDGSDRALLPAACSVRQAAGREGNAPMILLCSRKKWAGRAIRRR
jgi:hypothetical protein